jgi:hypothetical protein
MKIWKLLFQSRKFRLAIIAIAQTVVFSYIPDFPEAAWQAVDVILAALMVTIAAEDVAKKIGDGIRHSNGEPDKESNGS